MSGWIIASCATFSGAFLRTLKMILFFGAFMVKITVHANYTKPLICELLVCYLLSKFTLVHTISQSYLWCLIYIADWCLKWMVHESWWWIVNYSTTGYLNVMIVFLGRVQ
jgi:hypothetical protein